MDLLISIWSRISINSIFFFRPSYFFVAEWIITHPFVCFSDHLDDYKPEIPPEVRILEGQVLPPYFPNGWIPLLESRQIKTNQMVSLICFGKELIVARGSDDKIYIFDAYCPHLGANLAIGGTLEKRCRQDCIRCPFHAWSFRLSDGMCVDVPYESSPPNARIKIWNSIESNNIIFVWYHANDSEPEWSIDPIDEIITKKWTYKGRTEHLEIPENGADVTHLNQIHSSAFYLGSNINLSDRDRWYSKIIEHSWAADWTPCSAPKQHTSKLEILHETKFFGMRLFRMKLDVTLIGPAYVELRFRCFSFFGEIDGIILQQVKPIQPMRNSIVHSFYLDSSLKSYLFSKFLLFSEAKMLERDVRIWNRKAFLRKPFIAKSERCLAKYRRWFHQFYSNQSKTLNDW
ncbi:Rieske domain-containing protein [Sarcoptes scabiei]|uniref:cholesterol 7-desaturase n=1 Tax=Sarcoptes scabiei TaxID=52283 RepID=A0A132A803_SARSC|nr:Rieske domain-containing protein [Sarcoptes scabiei]